MNRFVVGMLVLVSAELFPLFSFALEAVAHAPDSTLLKPGSTEIDFTMTTDEAASCGYALENVDFAQMTGFQSTGDLQHSGTITGLSADPIELNHVWIRCDADPDFALHLRFRAIAEVNPAYPRTGNLWGWGEVTEPGLEHAARIDLFLGAWASADEIRELRKLNPDVLVLTSINTVEEAGPEETGLPMEWYLLDINGHPVEVWPGAYRLNMTLPEVAAYKARQAYDTIAERDFAPDGCFFDNFQLLPSWLDADIWGNPVELDADRDGVADDPDTLDALWRDGVYAELEAFRAMMPHAYISGHAIPQEPRAAAIFHGDSIGFALANVLEGEDSFTDVWDRYHWWWSDAREPAITMFESSPRDDIAYGWDYEPLEKVPESTLEFARSYYPDIRFGLAMTLMNDGYFAHEYGDTWHGNDWWFDELDYPLGTPCGPAERVLSPEDSSADLLLDGAFDNGVPDSWGTWVNEDAGAVATFSADNDSKEGDGSIRADIANAGEGVSWHVSLYREGVSVEAGKSYDLRFYARADADTVISVNLQKSSPDWDNYGLWGEWTVGTEWQLIEVSFEAAVSATDGRLGFNLGSAAGSVWIDGVTLTPHPRDVFLRQFSEGLVLLNGTRDWQSVYLPKGFSRLEGEQAPRWQFLVDDEDAAFRDDGWARTEYDSREWTAVGPFYHDFGPSMRTLDSGAGTASWKLPIRSSDHFTVAAWWPGGPEAENFAQGARYQIVVDGEVIDEVVLDQRENGDEWHVLGTWWLRSVDDIEVRLVREGHGTAVADALHVYSESRFNDGTKAPIVELGPLDGVVLKRDSRESCGALNDLVVLTSSENSEAYRDSEDDEGCGCVTAGSNSVSRNGLLRLLFSAL